MSVEHTLLDLAACLKSSKKKDRTKGLSHVSTLIEKDDIARYLSKCSRNLCKGTSWDIVFVHVHEAVMTEVEHGRFSQKFLLSMGQSLIAVVEKANGLIKAKTLVSAVLSTFEAQSAIPVELCKVYYDLASAHLLQLTKYRAGIGSNNWTDLVNMCKRQYANPRPGGSSLKFLELLCKTVTAGVRYSLTIPTLLELLPFFTNILLSDIPPSASFECYLLLAVNTTLRALVSDARYQVASFTENVVQSIIRMYKSSSDNNVLIFEILGIALNVHHPLGAGCDDLLFYSLDSNLWKTVVYDILQLCEREVSELLRSGDSSLITKEFITLFVDTSYVTSLMRLMQTPELTPDDEVDNTLGILGTAQKRKSSDSMINPTQKRAKLVSANTSMGNILADMSSKDYWFWLRYLGILLERHPSAVDKDYENVVRVVCNLISDAHSCPMGPLIKCADHLLLHSSRDEFRDLWTPCFESLLKSVVKDNSDEQHQMLQVLISHGIVKDSSLLLKIFVSNHVSNTASSLKTLQILAQMESAVSEFERCSLLSWGLSDLSHPAEAACLAVVLLFKEQSPIHRCLPQFEDFTEIYKVLTLNEECVAISRRSEEKKLKLIYAKVADCLMDILPRRPAVSNHNAYEALVEDAKHIELILRILSSVWQEETLKNKLLTVIQPLFVAFLSDCESQIKAQNPFRIEVISHLFGLDLHPCLEKLLRNDSFTNDGFSQTLIDLYNTSLKKDTVGITGQPKLLPVQRFASKFTQMIISLQFPDLEKMLITEITERAAWRRTIRILELLCQIGDISQLMHLMDETIRPNFSKLKLRVILQLVYTIAELPEKSADHLNQCLKVLQTVCRKHSSDTCVLLLCIAIIRSMVAAIGNQGDGTTFNLFVELMEIIRNVVTKQNGTVSSLAIGFINVLTETCKFTALAQKQWENADTRMIEDVLKYINSPSVAVRLVAARSVEMVLRLHSSFEIFQRLRRQLAQSKDHRDEFDKMAMASTSLMTLAYALSAADESRFIAAYTTIDIIRSQDIIYELVNNFLGLLSRLLRVDDASKYFRRHLKDLLTNWLDNGNQLKDFPYPVLKCNNIVEFYNEHIEVIGAVCFVSEKRDMLDEIVTRLNTTLSCILEKAFPVIACLTNGQLPALLYDYISPERQDMICSRDVGKIAYMILRDNSANQKQALFSQVMENARAVQQALLLFEEDLVESVTDEDVFSSLVQYSGFVKKYVEETKNNACNNNHHFVLRDTISVTLRFLSEKRAPKTLNVACDLIKYVIDGYIPILKSEIIDLLPGVVNTLAAVSTDTNNEPAENLLRYLIIDQREEFVEALARLDPFPDDHVFTGLTDVDENCGLREEMKRFTQIVGHKGRRVGGLARLLRALENYKQELRELVEEAWTVSKDTLLHQVLQQLVELCAHKDEAVRTEAAKCLGELGPTDLNTLVIKQEKDEGSVYTFIEHRLVDSVLQTLGQIVQTESLAVKQIACKALYGIMRYEGDFSQCSHFCAPFMSQHSLSELIFFAKSNNGPPVDVWLPSQKVSHDLWVQDLTNALLGTLGNHDGLSVLLQEMCKVHVPFAQELLPLILGVAVEVGDSVLIDNITSNINQVFANHVTGNKTLELKSIGTLVEAIDYLRRWNFRRGWFGASLNNEKGSVSLDLLAIAEAAGNCGAYFTSIMFAELWYEDSKTANYSCQPDVFHVNVDDLQERPSTLSRVMRAGFASVGVLDGLHGCGSSHLTDPAQRMTHLEQTGRWDICLVMHDAMENSKGVSKALSQLDLPYTLSNLPGASNDQLLCAAKLGDWSQLPAAGTETTFHFHHYSALKALHNRDTVSMMDEVAKATAIVLKTISENTMESPQNLYESLAHLQCLKYLRDVENGGPFDQLREKWQLQDFLKPSSFSLLADVLQIRCVVTKELSEDSDLLAEQYIRLCKLARKAGKNEVALRNIFQLSQLTTARKDLLQIGEMEEARYFWEKGVHENGTFLLSRLLQTLKNTNQNDLYAKCLRMYGKWMVERKAENPHDVIEKYFIKSLKHAKHKKNKLEAYAAIAKFSYENYIELKEYLDSSTFENSKINLQQRMDTVQGMHSNPTSTRNLILAQKEGEIDLKEVAYLQQESKTFLSLAVRYYVLSLQSGDKYDHFVFRLVSLWLRNLHAVPEEDVAKIPSYKFISLLPQIVPRMHGDATLTQTVERILKEHPYHTLPFLCAVKNSHADQQYIRQSIEKPTARMIAAFKMLQKARNVHGVLISEMETFTEALIHLANLPCPADKAIDSTVCLHQCTPVTLLSNLNTVVMPSEELAVQQNLQYNNIIGIHRFNQSYELVGGINHPKKIECVGTDGKTRVLLVKGQDDLRQDAVMQQVFSVINSLLARNEETARHKLVMRTYRVVPLSQLSGIIGWCANTQPLGLYLVGRPSSVLGRQSSGGAHVRFRPNDMKPSDARKMMASLSTDPETRLRGFLQICRQLRPVFHYFFLENFPSAGMAFDRRLAYTRSVATSSMIGYILGLGDRHVMNILIDNVTAEVIHIDLGIAFEKGQLLKSPETVPFRLTRDVVDGMGLTGVDGVFRSCCKRTMGVLRENKDIIMTLLEVLLYDPLNTWIVNTTPTWSEASSSAVDSVNVMAERALARVSLKLQGLDKGVVTTVEGQVNGLIQQAMDTSNLSRLFVGWQPYV